MDPLEMIPAALASMAGILAATFTTIACSRRHAREERDRQLFRAYLEDPQEVEAWLVGGAAELLEQSLSRLILKKASHTERQTHWVHRHAENAVPALVPHHQAA